MDSQQGASLLDRLSQTPAMLRQALQETPEHKLRARPAPDAFAPIEVAWHLRDIEIEGWLARIRRILDEPTPLLASIDGDQLARERHYLILDPGRAVEEFSSARRQSVATLRALPPHRWSWSGIFEGRPLTLGRLAELMLQHDLDHIDGLRGHAVRSRAA